MDLTEIWWSVVEWIKLLSRVLTTLNDAQRYYFLDSISNQNAPLRELDYSRAEVESFGPIEEDLSITKQRASAKFLYV